MKLSRSPSFVEFVALMARMMGCLMAYVGGAQKILATHVYGFGHYFRLPSVRLPPPWGSVR